MKNNLLSIIGKGIILPIVFALSSCGIKTYEIDGNKVKFKEDSFFWNIKEIKKDGTNNEFYMEGGNINNPLEYFQIPKELFYTQEDSLVFSTAKQKADYLISKRDSLDEVERQKRINCGLKALEY
jgi:hypothetical protein